MFWHFEISLFLKNVFAEFDAEIFNTCLSPHTHTQNSYSVVILVFTKRKKVPDLSEQQINSSLITQQWSNAVSDRQEKGLQVPPVTQLDSWWFSRVAGKHAGAAKDVPEMETVVLGSFVGECKELFSAHNSAHLRMLPHNHQTSRNVKK